VFSFRESSEARRRTVEGSLPGGFGRSGERAGKSGSRWDEDGQTTHQQGDDIGT
jgi:hypothetical protein